MLLSETQITAELRAETSSGGTGANVSAEKSSEKAVNTFGEDNNGAGCEDPPALIKAKVEAEKRRREHMLALNQALAKEVIERTKLVAGSSLIIIIFYREMCTKVLCVFQFLVDNCMVAMHV